MGVRGISQILDFEDNEQVIDIVTKQADYLCNIGDKFGPTLMDPNSDPNVYRVNEDNSRVTDNRANIMAVDVLCTAYEHTGNERYLEWILKYLEAFIASSVSGLGGRVYDIGMGRVGKWNYEIQRNVSLLRTSDNLSELFENEREKIIDMGFEHLALVFDEGTKSLGQYGEGTVNFPYATRTVYENNGTKSIMMMNAIPQTATEYDESWGQDVAVMFKENRIWEGCTNLVNSPLNVILAEYLDFKGILRGIQRPIYIEDFAGEAKINLTQYSEEKISLTFSGEFETAMALILDECEEMIKVAEETGMLLMVGQVCRCAPGFMKAKELVENGTIGELYFVESEYAHDYVDVRGVDEWRVTPEREPIIGGACHAIDLLRWIAGDPIETTAYSNHKMLTDWPINDTTVAIMKFPNNVIGKVFTSIGCKRDYTMRTVLYGTKGTIIVNNTDPELTLYLDKDNNVAFGDRFSNVADKTVKHMIKVEVNHHNVPAEHKQMIDAILNGTPLVTTGREGARTVAVCRAVVESAATGKSVEIKYPM